MEVSQVLSERARWDVCMPVFANLLRPSMKAESAVKIDTPDGEALDASITAFRKSDDGQRLATWGDQLVPLVFDGYADWAEYYAAQPEWVLTCLAQVLEDANQQNSLLERLTSIGNAMPESRVECLSQFAGDIDLLVPRWLDRAREERADAGEPQPGSSQDVQSYPNTANWTYSRTPGTLYYAYRQQNGGDVYVYSDEPGAPEQDWHEAKYWDDLADAAARKPENKVTARFPEWDASWAEWSVLDNPAAEGRLVYGKASEGRWYDYDGALEAHGQELRAAREAQAAQAAAGSSPGTVLVQDLRDEVLVPISDRVMSQLPAETAGKAGMEPMVKQLTRYAVSQKLAAQAAEKDGSQP